MAGEASKQNVIAPIVCNYWPAYLSHRMKTRIISFVEGACKKWPYFASDPVVRRTSIIGFNYPLAEL